MGNNRIFFQNTLRKFQYNEEIALKFIVIDCYACGDLLCAPRRGKFENNTILYGKCVLKFNGKLTSELNLTFCDVHHGTN